MIFITEDYELKFKFKTQAFYFYATWMPFHKKMLVMIDKVENKYKDIDFYAIDSDHLKTICKQFKIESIPTVVIWSKLNEIKRINGFVLTKAFMHAFDEVIQTVQNK